VVNTARMAALMTRIEHRLLMFLPGFINYSYSSIKRKQGLQRKMPLRRLFFSSATFHLTMSANPPQLGNAHDVYRYRKQRGVNLGECLAVALTRTDSLRFMVRDLVLRMRKL